MKATRSWSFIVFVWALGMEIFVALFGTGDVAAWQTTFSGVLVASAGVFFVADTDIRQKREKDAQRDKLIAEAFGTKTKVLDWCEGCDEVHDRTRMALNDLGLYRCTQCRSTPPAVDAPIVASLQELLFRVAVASEPEDAAASLIPIFLSVPGDLT